MQIDAPKLVDDPALADAYRSRRDRGSPPPCELLSRVAAQAGDAETVQVAGRILAQEPEAPDKLWSLLDQAVGASLRELEMAARCELSPTMASAMSERSAR